MRSYRSVSDKAVRQDIVRSTKSSKLKCFKFFRFLVCGGRCFCLCISCTSVVLREEFHFHLKKRTLRRHLQNQTLLWTQGCFYKGIPIPLVRISLPQNTQNPDVAAVCVAVHQALVTTFKAKDVIFSLLATNRENWSFGLGVAQYVI